MLQHLKALLTYETDGGASLPNVEHEIESTLRRLIDMTKGKHQARAEFYNELTEMLKSEKLARSKKLVSMRGNDSIRRWKVA